MSDLHVLDTGCKWCNCRVFIEAPEAAHKRYAAPAVINAHYVERFARWMMAQCAIPPMTVEQVLGETFATEAEADPVISVNPITTSLGETE